jgi:cell wall-associated NlpC family hydrolase
MNRNFFSPGMLLVFAGALAAQTGVPALKSAGHGRPALISAAELGGFGELSAPRRALIEAALAVARDSPWLPYKFGGSSPLDGGFDCSGAIWHVLQKAGLDPPRTSAAQFSWVADRGMLHKVPAGVVDLDHPSMAALRPGDLLFWSGTYQPGDSRVVNITHVAIFLGREMRDRNPVMINATDGRSYRGRKANGYGVYDFQLPRGGARAVFAGYGTPPGLK